MWLFLAHVLGYDVWFYVSHVLLHTRFFYPIHKIHHEKTYPVWIDTYHGHWFETFFQSFGFFVPLAFVSPTIIQTSLALMYINLRAMLAHDPRGSWLVGTHHLDHHKYLRGNYGVWWIDWVMGTTLTHGCRDPHSYPASTRRRSLQQ